jgi:hypothetical protein
VGGLADRDAVADGLQTRGQVRHLARHHEIVHGPAGCHRFPGGDTDPKDKVRPVLLLEHGVELSQALLHGEGGAHGALGVVLIDPRHPENGHDGVAGELLDGATEGLDLLTHLVEEGRQERAEVLGVALGGKLRRALEVGEQNGDRLTLVRGGHQARYSSPDRVRRPPYARWRAARRGGWRRRRASPPYQIRSGARPALRQPQQPEVETEQEQPGQAEAHRLHEPHAGDAPRRSP